MEADRRPAYDAGCYLCPGNSRAGGERNPDYAGVYVFHDLVMAGLGVCALDDIAISVVATVIGHQPAKGWIITDAGWMAMSRDRGTAALAVDQGYGLVMSPEGELHDDLIVSATSQEHGIMSIRPGTGARLPAPARNPISR